MRTDQVNQRPGSMPCDPSPPCGHRPCGAWFAGRILVLVILLSGGVTAPRAAHADLSLTYTIVDYPAAQNGYTISGTITTNGATGIALPAADITSWSITIKMGTQTIEDFDTTNSVNAGFRFDATTTTITVATTPELIEFDSINDRSSISWISGVGYRADFGDGTPLWDTTLTPSAPVATAVPEPSTGVIAVSGAVTGLAIVLVRKRRAQRR